MTLSTMRGNICPVMEPPPKGTHQYIPDEYDANMHTPVQETLIYLPAISAKTNCVNQVTNSTIKDTRKEDELGIRLGKIWGEWRVLAVCVCDFTDSVKSNPSGES